MTTKRARRAANLPAPHGTRTPKRTATTPMVMTADEVKATRAQRRAVRQRPAVEVLADIIELLDLALEVA